jgi:hypothetical protein
VRELVRGFSGADRLSFKPAVSANALFGDPYPGHNKQLRARYRIQGQHGTLALDFTADGRIPVPFLMMVPQNRYLKVRTVICMVPVESICMCECLTSQPQMYISAPYYTLICTYVCV